MPVHEYASREKQEVEWCRQRSIDHQSKRKHETTLSHEMDLDLWSEDTELPTPFFATPVPNEELADHFCLSPLAHINQCNFRFYEVTVLFTPATLKEQTSATKKIRIQPIWVNIIGLQPSYDDLSHGLGLVGVIGRREHGISKSRILTGRLLLLFSQGIDGK